MKPLARESAPKCVATTSASCRLVETMYQPTTNSTAAKSIEQRRSMGAPVGSRGRAGRFLSTVKPSQRRAATLREPRSAVMSALLRRARAGKLAPGEQSGNDSSGESQRQPDRGGTERDAGGKPDTGAGRDPQTAFASDRVHFLPRRPLRDIKIIAK